MKRSINTIIALLATLILSASSAGGASAHTQVRPFEAAPGDTVKFDVLVPGETDARTTKVVLAVPKEVIPFSFTETPGWTLEKKEASDGSIAQLIWRGNLPADGLAEFSFLASTPTEPTTIVWKSIQYYSDGKVARWIGSPQSEYPASRTLVTSSAERQGAGGSHADDEGSAAQARGDSEGGAPGWTAPVAAVALALALLALVASLRVLIAVRRGRR